mgnify:CR=1 FL=1
MLVGEIIKKLMRNPKLSEKLDKLDALEIWNEIIGIQLCKYILDQKIHKGILYVKLKSAVVRNELSYNKSDLINQINQKLEKDLISDIVLK